MADIEVTIGARDEATKVIREFAKELGQQSKKVEFSLKGMFQMAGVKAAVDAAESAIKQLKNSFSEAYKESEKLDKAAKQLGHTVSFSPDATKKMASDLQASAIILGRKTGEDAAGLMRSMNEELKRGASVGELPGMTKAAIGLSKVFDEDLAESMFKVREATKGNFAAFQGLIPGIEALSSKEEKLAAVVELARKGIDGSTDSTKDSFEAMKTATGDLFSTFEHLPDQIEKFVFSSFLGMYKIVDENVIPIIESLADKLAFLGIELEGLGDKVLNGFVVGFTIAEQSLMRFGDVLDVIAASTLLSINRIYNDTAMVFDGLLAKAEWFVDSYAKLLSGRFTFEDVLKEMPAFGERAITETEKSLQAILDQSVGSLTEGFDEKIKERLAVLQTAMQLDIAIDLKPRAGAASALQDQIRSLTAFESRVLVRGQTDSPIAKLVENTARQVKEQERTNVLLDNANRSPSEELRIEIVK
jgi:hypothetical protein